MMIRPLMILTRSALALSLLLGSAAVSSAASYGNFYSPGATVQFLNVADLNGLFGAPTVSFESLDFSPNTFEADCAVSASCPPTPHTVSDTLTLQIAATAGNFIEKIRLSEAGDTSINSFLNAFAATSVTADVFVDILAIDGIAVNGVNANTQMVFTSGGTFDTNTQGSGTHTWTGNLLLELDAIIAAAALTGQATLVELSISNTLTAFAESGASARIEKKDFDGVGITVIPEPASALLMGFGLAGLAWMERRSSV